MEYAGSKERVRRWHGRLLPCLIGPIRSRLHWSSQPGVLHLRSRFGYWLSAIGYARSACYSFPTAVIDAAVMKAARIFLILS
jgi:hypothetical protein